MTKGSYNACLNHHTYHIFFSHLSSPLRIGIMLSLREAEKNVTQISEDLGVEQSKVSHALASLKHCHIVVSKTNGKERIYSLNKDTIVPILKIIDKHSSLYCKGDCGFKKEMIDNKKELNLEKVGVV